MDATIFNRLGAATVFVTAVLAGPLMPAASAGGGGHGVMMPRPGGMASGWHGGGGGFRGPVGGPGPRFGMRGLPPVSGIIHERPGMRPFVSGYGHTNTGSGSRGFAGLALGGYGHTATAATFGPRRFGHTATGLRSFDQSGAGFGAVRRVSSGLPALYGAGRGRFVGPGFARLGRGGAFRNRIRLAGARGGFGYGFGGLGYGYGGDAGYGAAAGAGSSVSVDISGGPGSYGTAGSYGPGVSTQAGGYGGAYRSETPLAATMAEPPLAPSPGEGFNPGNRYAYAAADDVPYAAHIVSVNRAARRDCACGPRAHVEPTIYRYGVGTAY